jgi:hypothetical protein
MLWNSPTNMGIYPNNHQRFIIACSADPGQILDRQMLETIGDIFQRYLPFVEGISLDFTINTLW